MLEEEMAWAEADDFLERLARSWQADGAKYKPARKRRKFSDHPDSVETPPLECGAESQPPLEVPKCDLGTEQLLVDRSQLTLPYMNSAASYTIEPKLSPKVLFQDKVYDAAVERMVCGKDQLMTRPISRQRASDMWESHCPMASNVKDEVVSSLSVTLTSTAADLGRPIWKCQTHRQASTLDFQIVI
jgi:hypothetical protein